MMGLSRLASRANVARASLTKSSNVTPSLATFHSSGVKNSEQEEKVEVTSEVAVPQPNLFSKLGLDDWKISAPIGIALAVPAIHNGIYVLNEETQIAACFMMFCTSVYKFGGDMIADYFDSRSNAILSEHNEIEDTNIALAKEALDAHKATLDVHTDISALNEAYKEAVKVMCQTETLKLKHEMRDVFQKNLDSIVEAERTFKVKLQDSMVQYATERVRENILQGGKSAKDEAFKSAIATLSSDKPSETEDPMVSMFVKELRAFGEKAESQEGKVVKLTPDEVAEVQSALDAFTKRNNMEEAELKAESEFTMKLIK